MWRVFVKSEIFFLKKTLRTGAFNAWEMWNATKIFPFGLSNPTEPTKATQISDFFDLIFRLNRHIRQNRLLDKRLFRLHNPRPLDKLFPWSI